MMRSSVAEKLKLLQALDSVIDFSKSTVQLEIVFALMFSPKHLTPTELSYVCGEPRKSVLDALRKLELKGVVVKTGERSGEYTYGLGGVGRRYADGLKFLLGISDTIRGETVTELGVREKIQLQRSFLEVYYAYKAMVALANAPRRTLSLSKLASTMGLSMDRARSYLDLFSRPPGRIFRKINTPRGVYYRLEEAGFSLYRRTPHSRLDNNKAYRLLKNLFKEYWPEKLEAKAVKTLAAAGAIVSAAATLLAGHPLLGLIPSIFFASILVLRSLLP